MEAALNLRPTETGANVTLLAPFDDVVFERTWTEGGLTSWRQARARFIR